VLIPYCEKYNITKALCVLYDRIGNYEKSIKTYVELIKMIISKVNYLGMVTIKYKKKLLGVFEDCLNVCKNMGAPSAEENETVWLGFVNSFIQVYNQNREKYDTKAVHITDHSATHSDELKGENLNIVEQLMCEYLYSILDSLYNHVEVDRLSNFYINNRIFFDMRQKLQKDLHIKLSRNLNNEMTLYKYVADCCADGLIHYDSQTLSLRSKGSKPSPHCQICSKRIFKKNISQSDDVIFRVKEDYSKDCFHQECKINNFENLEILNTGRPASSNDFCRKSDTLSRSTVDKDGEVDGADLLGALDDLMGIESSEAGSGDSLDQDEKWLMKIKFADNIMTRYDMENNRISHGDGDGIIWKRSRRVGGG
jgi:hypothetical protein